jgi:hypothetical protein
VRWDVRPVDLDLKAKQNSYPFVMRQCVMRQREVPLLAPPPRKRRPEDVDCYATKARGLAVLTTPHM